MKVLNQGFDHVEYTVEKIAPVAALYEKMGFSRIGEGVDSKKKSKSVVYAQGFVRLVLTEATQPGELNFEFRKAHGDGISVLGIEVEDAKGMFATTTSKGGRPATEPYTATSPEGSVTIAEVYTPSDLRYRFVERRDPRGRLILDFSKPALLLENLPVQKLEAPSPLNIRVIDHLTNNVGMGEMATWVDWYKRVFDFKVTRHFDIRTGRTGLISDVVESQDRKIKVPINEATEKASQVQEFVDRFHGVGVQHMAFLTTDITHTVSDLKKKNVKFLSVPSTYYEKVPTRVPGVTEDLRELERLGLLLDGDSEGYLMQLFTGELMGPFFLEFIQRKGNQGFGEGNFRALFEAIERDQVQRGVLTPA